MSGGMDRDGEPKYTQAELKSFEEAAKKKAQLLEMVQGSDEHKRELLEKMKRQIEHAHVDRIHAEKEMNTMLAKKALAEETIKRITAERLAKANELGEADAQKVIFDHFIMGMGQGHAGNFQIKTVFDQFGLINVLYSGSYVLAVRTEVSPGHPVFLVCHGGSLSGPDDVQMIQTLEKLIKNCYMPYVFINSCAIKSVYPQI